MVAQETAAQIGGVSGIEVARETERALAGLLVTALRQDVGRGHQGTHVVAGPDARIHSPGDAGCIAYP